MLSSLPNVKLYIQYTYMPEVQKKKNNFIVWNERERLWSREHKKLKLLHWIRPLIILQTNNFFSCKETSFEKRRKDLWKPTFYSMKDYKNIPANENQGVHSNKRIRNVLDWTIKNEDTRQGSIFLNSVLNDLKVIYYILYRYILEICENHFFLHSKKMNFKILWKRQLGIPSCRPHNFKDNLVVPMYNTTKWKKTSWNIINNGHMLL